MEVGLAIFFLAVVVKAYFHIKNGGKVFEFMTPEELQEHQRFMKEKDYVGNPLYSDHVENMFHRD